MSLTRPVRDFVGRKLHERGFYNIKGLEYNIKGLEEITTIDEFRERAFAIQRRSRKQTLDDVARLRKKYEQPIIGEVPVERLLELLAQIVDPTNIFRFCGSQLTHTLQVLESMEKVGITGKEFFATTLIHDLGKLAVLKGEDWENIEGGGKDTAREKRAGQRFRKLHLHLGPCRHRPCQVQALCFRKYAVGAELALHSARLRAADGR